jgi:hypothetical protein
MNRFLMRLDNERSFATTYQTDIEGSYGHIHSLLFAVGVFRTGDSLECRSGAGLPFGKKRAISNQKPYQKQHTNWNEDRQSARAM